MAKKKQASEGVPASVLKAAWIAGTEARRKYSNSKVENLPKAEELWNDEALYSMDAAALVILEWASGKRAKKSN